MAVETMIVHDEKKRAITWGRPNGTYHRLITRIWF